MKVANAKKIGNRFFEKTVLAIGNFDGVHRGHHAILNETVRLAKDLGVPSVIYTFQPHPRKVLFGPDSTRLLTDFDTKVRLLARFGIDWVVWDEFTRDYSEQTAAEFVERRLVSVFHVTHVLLGYDSHFGKDRTGGANELVELGRRFSFKVDQLGPVHVGERPISSTWIRERIEVGDLQTANDLLGYRYFLNGLVWQGFKRGRTIGYPTANLMTQAEILPAMGVYATRVRIDGKILDGVTNVGRNPTFTGEDSARPVNIETHIFDFDSDIYGRRIDVVFYEKIRDEKKFGGLDELKGQIARDAAQAREILKAAPAPEEI